MAPNPTSQLAQDDHEHQGVTVGLTTRIGLPGTLFFP